MRINLRSSVSFVDGRIHALRLVGSLEVPVIPSPPLVLRHNMIDECPIATTGRFVVWILDSHVESSRFGKREVDGYPLMVDIGPEAIEREVVVVDVDPSFVVIQVVDTLYTAQTDSAVGLTCEGGTLEFALRAKRTISLLLDPGEYFAYSSAPPPFHRSFRFEPGGQEQLISISW